MCELGYAAAVLDSEGCIYTKYTKRGNGHPNITIGQRHPQMMERFHEAVGGIGYVAYTPRLRGREWWTYRAHGFDRVAAIMKILDPWLGVVKKAQYAKVLEQCGPHKPSRKLTWEQVCEIRSSPERNIDLAYKFNVDPSHISNIRRGHHRQKEVAL